MAERLWDEFRRVFFTRGSRSDFGTAVVKGTTRIRRQKALSDAFAAGLWLATSQGLNAGRNSKNSLWRNRAVVSRCVIDALPEIHATRAFVERHRGRAWLNYFNESQKGSYKWDDEQHIVQANRTEALDAAKKGIRDKAVILPRRLPLLDEFANHLASDAKKLVEDEETGSKSYRYIRTGTNHYSLAFTYDWIASEQERRSSGGFVCFAGGRTIMADLIDAHRREGGEWPPNWDKTVF